MWLLGANQFFHLPSGGKCKSHILSTHQNQRRYHRMYRLLAAFPSNRRIRKRCKNYRVAGAPWYTRFKCLRQSKYFTSHVFYLTRFGVASDTILALDCDRFQANKRYLLSVINARLEWRTTIPTAFLPLKSNRWHLSASWLFSQGTPECFVSISSPCLQFALVKLRLHSWNEIGRWWRLLWIPSIARPRGIWSAK